MPSQACLSHGRKAPHPSDFSHTLWAKLCSATQSRRNILYGGQTILVRSSSLRLNTYVVYGFRPCSSVHKKIGRASGPVGHRWVAKQLSTPTFLQVRQTKQTARRTSAARNLLQEIDNVDVRTASLFCYPLHVTRAGTCSLELVVESS